MAIKMVEADPSFWLYNIDEYVRLGLSLFGGEASLPAERQALKEGLQNAFRVRQAELKSMTRH